MIIRKCYNILLRIARKFLIDILNDSEVNRRLWIATNKIPPDRDMADHIRTKVGNLVQAKYRIATEQSARFVLENLPDAKSFDTPQALLEHCVSMLKDTRGEILEFGVFSGMTINLISGILKDRTVHGFDSFRGLPENWRDCPKGAFSSNGVLPRVNPNVKLHVGLFEDSIPVFIRDNDPFEIAFLHIDCDLYSSTKTVFEHLGNMLAKDCIIVFDEFFNYPNFQDHEFKAWFEYLERSDRSVEYIGYANELTSLALIIT